MLDIPVSLPTYPVSWFKEPFSLLCAMICRLYSLPNCSLFQAKWVPLANHILLIGHSFNWAQILSYNLRVEIEKYERTPDKRKPSFYMLGFVMDAFCASTTFPDLNWNWTEKYPPIHIYCYDLRDDNFIPRVYELCDLFLGSMYYNIFKPDAPALSKSAREMISPFGDWYVGQFFSYIRIWGSNIVHLLPRIVPDRMVLQELTYHTIIDGVSPKLRKHKKKSSPKFLVNIGNLMLWSVAHESLL